MVQKAIQSISTIKLIAIFILVVLIILLSLVIFGVIRLPFSRTVETISGTEVELVGEQGDCLILEQEFCDQLILKDSELYPGEKVAFGKLPIGTKIYAPEDGNVDQAGNFRLQKEENGRQIFETGYNFTVGQAPAGGPPTKLYGIVFFVDPEKNISKPARAGEVIGEITLDNMLSMKEYNLALTIGQFNSGSGTFQNVTQQLIQE